MRLRKLVWKKAGENDHQEWHNADSAFGVLQVNVTKGLCIHYTSIGKFARTEKRSDRDVEGTKRLVEEKYYAEIRRIINEATDRYIEVAETDNTSGSAWKKADSDGSFL